MSHDERYLAVGKIEAKGSSSLSNTKIGSLHLYSMSNGREAWQVTRHGEGVSSVAFSPGGLLLASAGSGKDVKLWDCATGKETGVLRGHRNRAVLVGFSPDGKSLISAALSDYRYCVKVWELGSLRERWESYHKGKLGDLGFSPDGKTIAVLKVRPGAGRTDARTIALLDAATGECIRSLDINASDVRLLRSSPDGNVLAWVHTAHSLEAAGVGASREVIGLWSHGGSGELERTAERSASTETEE